MTAASNDIPPPVAPRRSAGVRSPASASAPCSCPGPACWGPPRDRDTALAVLRRAVELGRQPHRHRPVLRTRRRQRADPRRPPPLSRRPGAREQGRRRPRRRGRLDPRPAARAAARRGGGQPPQPRRSSRSTWSTCACSTPATTAMADAARRPRQPAGRDGGAARRGEDRRHRDEQRHPRPAPPGPARRASPACRTPTASSTAPASALLDLCREHGIAWVPFFPLGSAFPGMPKVTEHPAVRAAATALGATPAQVGLAWLLGPRAQHPADPGHVEPRPPRRQHRHRRRAPRRRHHRRAR